MAEHPLLAAARRAVDRIPGAAVVVATCLAALALLAPGLLGSHERFYASWTGDALRTLVEGRDTVPSALAPVAWEGDRPLTVDCGPFPEGSRIELKLRTAHGEATVRVRLAGRAIATLDVGPRWRTYRLRPHGTGRSFRLEQPGSAHVPVHVARIKITDVEGYAEGVLNAWLVRRNARFVPSPASPRWALFGIVLLAALLAPGRGTRGVRAVASASLRPVAAVTAGLAAARGLAAAAGLRLIVTPGSAAAILGAAAAAGGIRLALRNSDVLQRPVFRHHRQVLEITAVALVLAGWTVALFGIVQGRFGGDVRGVARFGWRFPVPTAMGNVPELTRIGYDGQFYAVLSADPLLRDPETVRGLDNPGYRATRILIPLLAWVSAGGSPERAPTAYVLWCWILGLAAPFLGLFWFRRSRWRVLWFAALALDAGLVVSVLRATPDAAALALLLGALILAETRAGPGITAVGGILAVLARETSVLALPGLVWPDVTDRRWLRALVGLGAPLAVFGAWRLHVGAAVGRGFGSAWTNFGLPFGWLPDKVHQIAALEGDRRTVEILGVTWVLLLVSAALSYLIRRRRLSPVLITFLFFAALAVTVNIRVHFEVNASARVLIALPFLGALLVRDEPSGWRRILLAAGVVLAAVQGFLVLREEAGPAWRHELAVRRAQAVGAGVRTPGDGTRHAPTLTVSNGERVIPTHRGEDEHVSGPTIPERLSIWRNGGSVPPPGSGEAATLPAGPARGGLELRGDGPGPAAGFVQSPERPDHGPGYTPLMNVPGLAPATLLVTLLASGPAAMAAGSGALQPHPHHLVRGTFFAHALGQIDRKTYTNSREALEHNLRRGARFFEVDLSFTADGDLVCFHTGLEKRLGLDRPIDQVSTAEFLSRKFDGKYTTMDLETLLRRMAEVPDMYLVTDTKHEFRPSLETVVATAERVDRSLIGRIIPQFYHQEEWQDVAEVEAEHGLFATVIFTLYRTNLDDDAVVEAARLRKIPIITMSRSRYNPGLVARLAAIQTASMVHTINNRHEILVYLAHGVRGVYIDAFFPWARQACGRPRPPQPAGGAATSRLGSPPRPPLPRR